MTNVQYSEATLSDSIYSDEKLVSDNQKAFKATINQPEEVWLKCWNAFSFMSVRKTDSSLKIYTKAGKDR